MHNGVIDYKILNSLKSVNSMKTEYNSHDPVVILNPCDYEIDGRFNINEDESSLAEPEDRIKEEGGVDDKVILINLQMAAKEHSR